MAATRGFVAGVLAAGAAGVLLSGCDSPAGDASAPIVRPVVTGLADAGPFAGLTGRQVLDRADAAMESATSMRVDVTGTHAGAPLHLSATLAGAGTCASDVRMGPAAFRLLGDGTDTYLKADAGFWRLRMGRHAALTPEAMQGRWLRLTPRMARGVAFFCDLDAFTSRMARADAEGTVTRGRPTALAGRPVLPLVQKTPQDTTTIYVAAAGAPYVVRTDTADGDSPATATFAAFGEEPRIGPPPAGSVVDFADLDFGGTDPFAV